MRISDVLAALRSEFPGVSHSKLRFLEEQGLIEPTRTNSGYRQYSPADLERLRFVLLEQRDRYLPLRVIKEELAALDQGIKDETPAPRLAAELGQAAAGGVRWVSVDAMAKTTRVGTDVLRQLIDAHLIRCSPTGQVEAGAAEVVRAAATLAEHGIDVRHLRSLRMATDRQVALVEQVVRPWLAQHHSSARAQAATTGAEIGELLVMLHRVWVRQGIDDLTS